MNLAQDFLAAGPLLAERIKGAVPPGVFVLSTKDLAGVKESSQQAPAVHVIYVNYAPSAGKNGAWHGVQQQWMTVVVVRNVASMTQAVPSATEAGPLMSAVINALNTWVPAGLDGFQGIELKPAPGAGFTRAGFAYFPIAWGLDLRIRRGR